MKFVLFVFCLMVFSNSLSQNDFSEAGARQIIDTFFEGFHQGDSDKMKSVMAENMVMQTVFTNKNGKNSLATTNTEEFLHAVATLSTAQKWEERLLDYAVRIDGNLAHVWTPYQFFLDGSLSHCGANSFTLAKLGKGWKIIHVIDSRRNVGCR